MAHDQSNSPDQSLGGLIGGIVHDAQALLKREVALAKRELIDELQKAKQAALALGVGVCIVVFGCLLLVFMLVYLLFWVTDERLPLWCCYGSVGVALTALGGGLVFLGKRRAKAVDLLPKQTMATMERNVAWIKNQT